VSGKHPRIAFFPALIFFYSTVFAVNDTPSIFTRAERFFADSAYLSAMDGYRQCINGKRFLFRQNTDEAAMAFYKIGLCYYRTANYLAAATAFEEFLRLYPSDRRFADALIYCANAYAACGDFKNASEQWYRAWIRGIVSGDRQTPLLESARYAEKEGNDERAGAIYTEFLQKFPSDQRTKTAAPSCVALLIKQKKFFVAAAILDASEKQWHKDEAFFTRLLYLKALLARAQMRTENAARFFSALMGRSDDFPEKEQALGDYATLLAGDRQYKALLPVYKKMAEVQQKKGRQHPSWDFMVTWARCARGAGSLDLAEKLLQQTLEVYPGRAQAGNIALEMAECQLSKRDSGSALATLQERISGAYPDSVRAKAALAAGGVYSSQQLYPQAIAAYREYCSIPGCSTPDSVQFTIARTYQDKRLYATAIQEYDRLLRNYPRSARYFNAVLNAGRCEEALSHFHAAMDRYDYVIESDASPELIEAARKYRDCVGRFYIAQSEGAVAALGRLTQKDGDGGLASYERLMRVAGIFEDMLHDFPAALDVYGQVPRCIPAAPDSVQAAAVYCKASVLEKMFQKARCDHDSLRAAGLKIRALAMYQEASSSQRFPAIVDNAQFHIMMLGAPSIADLERYCARASAGGHLGEALMQIGDYYEKRAPDADGKQARKAIDAYTRVVRSAAGQYRSRALLSLARTWYAAGCLDSAYSSVRELTRLYPDTACMVEGAHLDALIEKKRGNYAVAVVKLQSVIAMQPFGELAQRARFDLASTQFASSGFSDALRDYRTYLLSYPGGENVLEARFGIARCQVRLGKSEEAGQALIELLKEKCPSALIGGIYYELAQCFKSKGDVQTALEYFQKALAVDSFPDKGAVYARMGGLYFGNSLYGDAVRAFTRFLPYAYTESDSLTGIIGIITSQTMDGQEPAAEKTEGFFKKRFGSRHPRYGEVVYYEGLRAVIDKRYEVAIKKFKTIAETFGASEYGDDAAYQIGLCYYYMGKQEKAFEVFHDFIEQYPGSSCVAMANFKIGMMLHDRGDYIPAAEAFEKVVNDLGGDEKTRFRAAYNAAIDYQKSSSWIDAARQYRTIIDSFPQEVGVISTYVKIGFCYIQASHFEEALKYFQKAATGASADEKPEIMYWTAQCWARLGDHQKAITEYLKVPPQGQWAVTSQFEAARLYEHTGEMKKAFALYKKIVASDGEKGVFGKEALAQCARLTPLVKDN